MLNRIYGNTDPTSGVSFGANRLIFPQGEDIKLIKAKVCVTEFEVTGCNSNPAVVGQARARLRGAFFNTSTPVPGSYVNDVVADIRIRRLTGSTDPPNVLQVVGYVYLCFDELCRYVATLGFIDLGTITKGECANLQVEWDQPNKRFIFQQDKEAEEYVYYTVPDSQPPGSVYGGSKSLELGHYLPNCTTEPRPVAFMEAFFDNVYIKANP